MKEQPDPPIQILKLYSEVFITLCKGALPSQQTVCSNLSCFITEWQQKTCRKLPATVKDDLYNVCYPRQVCNNILLITFIVYLEQTYLEV
jgi:hypothetical protein